MTTRRRYYRPRKPRIGARCWLNVSPVEFSDWDLDAEADVGKFREPNDDGWRLVAGNIVQADPFCASFEIQLGRHRVRLPWHRLVSHE